MVAIDKSKDLINYMNGCLNMTSQLFLVKKIIFASKGVCSSSMHCCFPILLRILQHCIWDPWGAFGHILKEWMSIISVSWGQTYPIWLLGQVWHFGHLRKVFAPPACTAASQFFYACCNIVFGTYGEPLGIY